MLYHIPSSQHSSCASGCSILSANKSQHLFKATQTHVGAVNMSKPYQWALTPRTYWYVSCSQPLFMFQQICLWTNRQCNSVIQQPFEDLTLTILISKCLRLQRQTLRQNAADFSTRGTHTWLEGRSLCFTQSLQMSHNFCSRVAGCQTVSTGCLHLMQLMKHFTEGSGR